MAPIDPTSGTDPSLQPSAPLGSSNVSPEFDSKEIMVVFFLGGPGSGKGTQSKYLVEQYGFVHFSAGDLLREEQDRKGSEFGDLIRDNIKNGGIVKKEVTVGLLKSRMESAVEKRKGETHTSGELARFLIDGFPRQMDQAIFFEETLCVSRCTIFLDCPENVMEERLLERGKSSGRADDNPESIKKRFRTFVETSMPVVDYYEQQGKVIKVSATGSPDEVWEGVKKGLAERGIQPSK